MACFAVAHDSPYSAAGLETSSESRTENRSCRKTIGVAVKGEIGGVAGHHRQVGVDDASAVIVSSTSRSRPRPEIRNRPSASAIVSVVTPGKTFGS